MMAAGTIVPGGNLEELPAIDADTGWVNVVIETPRGSRGKFKYDASLGAFVLHKVLPLGFDFPYDFGFVPSTSAADGDPLDVLVLLDVKVSTGIIVHARLIGALEAEQKELDGRVVRNDRLLAVPVGTLEDPPLDDIAALPDHLLDELETFFVDYNHRQGKEFRPLQRSGPEAAMALLHEAMKAARQKAGS
jgi:inorganic pyrophosphatase